MIVNLHKYLIVGNKSEVDRFFVLAQRAGFMEFVGLSNKKALEMPDDAKTILSAIKIVRSHSTASNAIYNSKQKPLELAQHVVHVNAEHEKLLEEQRILKAEIARVSPFGDFSRSELNALEKEGKLIFQFFCLKSELARTYSFPPEVIYVATEYELDYFVAINKEKKSYPKMIEITIDRSLSQLQQRLHEVRLEISKAEGEIHEAAKGLSFLQNGLLEYLDEYHLQLAKHDAAHPMGDALFAIEAWVPETKIKALHGLLSNLEVFAEEICIEERDKIPTCMENKGAGKMGEDLVHVYDTPAWTDKDPSLWILIFFPLFFAVIISDAGYGLIYLLIGLYMKWKFKTALGALRRFIKLTLLISVACIVWGTLSASFFGIEIGPNNPFRRVSLFHYMASKKAEYHLEMKDEVYHEYVKDYPEVATATDGHDFLVKASHVQDGKIVYDAMSEFYDSVLLEFSLFIGLIHISLSFIRYMGRNWTGFGWICFMIGSYLYFPSFLEATSFINYMGWISKPVAYAVGKQVLYGGLILVFVAALLQKKKWGALHEITNAIQVFADVLSYIRLYALALAGMIMANTFNEMGVKAGIIGGFFIILFGHAVNMVLSIQGGVIHGLRLNYLEWYRYSFEGGGRAFNPLRLRKNK